ncbi:hypothetical protein A6X20_34970 [Bradyrhizobium elkanii]|nr:hypothetical protein A6X20_34970 [Bradyrhizobium elkanii]ODM75652.1 hypothetical protein A6452_37220 [Bradyrhizobium elkanii]
MATAQVLGLVVRDAPQAALLTMRVYYCAAEQDLILRSPPKAGVSKDGLARDDVDGMQLIE